MIDPQLGLAKALFFEDKVQPYRGWHGSRVDGWPKRVYLAPIGVEEVERDIVHVLAAAITSQHLAKIEAGRFIFAAGGWGVDSPGVGAIRALNCGIRPDADHARRPLQRGQLVARQGRGYRVDHAQLTRHLASVALDQSGPINPCDALYNYVDLRAVRRAARLYWDQDQTYQH